MKWWNDSIDRSSYWNTSIIRIDKLNFVEYFLLLFKVNYLILFLSNAVEENDVTNCPWILSEQNSWIMYL